ncbi:MAG: 3-deoxy-7-phosphoheptulonate synthase, partial [Leptolyngbyaceae cyanobacterium SM2_5_2]|nr:3-deoxy-7-phosphoheptulonate synthase [Leptolyngbyaceae cyanobacterium SM2_5_2]
MQQTQDLHVVETRPLVSPALLHHELPMTAEAAALVAEARDRIR